MNRQAERRRLFDAHFERLHGAIKDQPIRKERRKLARAYAAGDWARRAKGGKNDPIMART